MAKNAETNNTIELTTEEFLNEPVMVQLVKDTDKYRHDVEIGVNGYKYIIQRGVPVSVPRKVAMILENAYRQQILSASVIEDAVKSSR